VNEFLKVGEFLLEHADLIGDVIDVVASGASKDSLRKAIRDLKIEISDEAMREELGLDK
jgi:hypothetical protein